MTFATPAVLFALAALPAIWWLLRLTPARPRAEVFPPARILAEIEHREETPANTPWWLLLLRLAIAALIIVALAGPSIAPAGDDAPGDGPLLIVIDNSWPAARDWDAHRDTALALAQSAETADRPVALVATAEGAGQVMAPGRADAAVDRIRSLDPRPYPPQHEALLPQFEATLADTAFGAVAWVSDGLAHPATAELRDLIAAEIDGPVTLYRAEDAAVRALEPPENASDALTATLVRSADGGLDDGTVLARDLRGRIVAEAAFAFAENDLAATARFELPQEIRNDIVRLEIAGERTAGAVQLLDERYRRRSVGVIGGDPGDQPLLSPEYYLTRAITPFADPVATGSDVVAAIDDLVASGTSVIVLADIGTLPADSEATLAGWIENGGTLVRFAGPRLASGEPGLIPVPLRSGGRVIGGTLSWEEPQPLGPFPEDGPFAGLAVPGDVTIDTQVLAEPSASLVDRSWAVLADGTPLVTAADQGEGRIILFHVTADPEWSNLPLSGVFVEMLQRITQLANAPAEARNTTNALAPYQVLDGAGRLVEPGDAVEPLPGDATAMPGPTSPPGLYGDENGFRAFNLIPEDVVLQPIDGIAGDATLAPLAGEERVEIAPWLFAAALVLFLLDTAAVIWIVGGNATRRAEATAAISALILVLPILGDPASAQDELSESDRFAQNAANNTTLAYVVTGDETSDEIARAGLNGLSWILRQRTAFEPAEPIGVDIADDELAFFPLLYWRVAPQSPMPDDEAMARLDAYMRAGGIVLFDTADQLERDATALLQSNTAAGERLQAMLSGLDIPPLEPVPADHVLTQSYYILPSFPGRYAGGEFWVEVLPEPTENDIGRPARPTDDVSPIMVTSNDLAGAWAISDSGAFLFPVSATDPRQRELAFRAGVNVVMYALTGNYKTDQVHVPDLLDRLGQ